MPTYTVIHEKTGEEKDIFCSFSELETYLKENPDWSKMISAPNIITHTGNVVNKTSGDWKDLMKNIKKGSGEGNTIKS